MPHTTHTHTLYLSLSHTHTHTHTRARARTHTHTLSLSPLPHVHTHTHVDAAHSFVCACGDLTNEYPGREYAVPKGDEQVEDFKKIASGLHKDIAMVRLGTLYAAVIMYTSMDGLVEMGSPSAPSIVFPRHAGHQSTLVSRTANPCAHACCLKSLARKFSLTIRACVVSSTVPPQYARGAKKS